MKAKFKGSGVALVTPFNQLGEVDYEVLAKLLEFKISNSTDAIIVNGTTAESATLSYEEQLSVIDFVVKTVSGRIPVIAGTGSNNTAHMVKLSLEAEKLGVDGLLCVTPYYLKTTQEGLYQHFLAVHDAVSIPIILYNVPGRTNMNLSPETTQSLSLLPKIIGLKDASGDLKQTQMVIDLCGPDFAIYSGNDDLIKEVVEMGGLGVISVLANILPKETHLIASGTDFSLQSKYLPLINLLFDEPSPIPVKRALQLMHYGSMHVRLPLVNCTDSLTVLLEAEMKEVELL